MKESIRSKIYKSKTEYELRIIHFFILTNSKNINIIEYLLTKIFNLSFYELFEEVFETYMYKKSIFKNNLEKYVYCLLKQKKFKELDIVYNKYILKINLKKVVMDNIYYNCSIAFRYLNKQNKAIELLNKIKFMKLECYIELAQNYREIKQTNKAILIYNKLIKNKNSKDKLFGYFNLGEIYAQRNELELLKKIIIKCENLIFKCTSSDYRATRLYLLGFFYETLNKKIEAFNYYKLSANCKAELLIDIDYKKKSIKKL